MSNAEWTDPWNDLPTTPITDSQAWDFVAQATHNLRKRLRAGNKWCKNWPLGSHEWDIDFRASLSDPVIQAPAGVVASVTTDGTTITITDGTSPSATLIDGFGVKRFVGFAGTWRGSDITAGGGIVIPASYQIIVDCDNPDPSQPLVATVTDTPTGTTIEVADDGTWTLNRALEDLVSTADKPIRYCFIRTDAGGTGPAYTWMQRWMTRPVWTLAKGTVPVLSSGTATSGSNTTHVEDTAHNGDPLWADPSSFDGTCSVELDLGGGDKDWKPITAHTVTPTAKLTTGAFGIDPTAHTYNIISSTTTTLTDAGKSFSSSLAGEDLMVQVGGKWTRIPITAVAGDTLTFAAQTVAPAGDYWVTRSGTYWTQYAAENPSTPWKWYCGLMDGYWSHQPDGTLAGESTIAQTVKTISRGLIGFSCVDEIINPWEWDLVLDPYEDHCSSDYILNPGIYQCFAGLWMAIVQVAPNFILDFDLIDADHRSAMTPGAPSMLMRQIGGVWTHYVERTIASVSGGNAVLDGVVLMPDGELEHDCHFTRFDGHDLYQDAWAGTLTNDSATAPTLSTLIGDGMTFTDAAIADGGDIGKIVGISFGKKTLHPRRVSRLYTRIIRVPDTDEDGAIVDPPTAEFPGTLQIYDRSTNYAEYGEQGRLSDSGRAFVADDLARYVGGNAADPTSDDKVGAGTPDPDLLTIYYDAAFVGGDSTTDKQFLQPASRGTVVAATATQITVDTSLWSGAPSVIIGTDGATDATFDGELSDSTQASSGFFTATNSDGSPRMVGEFLEVELDPDGAPDVWSKRLITGLTGTTFAPDTAFGATTNGRRWRVREASSDAQGRCVVSYWTDATLRVTDAGGVDHDFPIVAHDDHDVVVTASDYTAQPNDKWQIVFWPTGVVLKFADSAWGKPDTDAPLTAIAPTAVTNYAFRDRIANYVTGGDGIAFPLVQIKKGIDALHLTPIDNAWDSGAHEDDDPQYTDAFTPLEFYNLFLDERFGGVTTDGQTNPDTYDEAWGLLSADWVPAPPWNGSVSPSAQWQTNNEPPYQWSAFLANNEANAPYSAQARNHFNHLVVTPWHCARFDMTAPAIEAWCYTTINADDPDDGSVVGTTAFDFATDALTAVAAPGGGATLLFRKWTRVFSDVTAAATVNITVGDKSFPQPQEPPEYPDYDISLDPGGYTTNQVFCGAYVLEKFAIADWQPVFDSPGQAFWS